MKPFRPAERQIFPSTTSWWTAPTTRAEFDAAVKAEQHRMHFGKGANWVSGLEHERPGKFAPDVARTLRKIKR